MFKFKRVNLIYLSLLFPVTNYFLAGATSLFVAPLSGTKISKVAAFLFFLSLLYFIPKGVLQEDFGLLKYFVPILVFASLLGSSELKEIYILKNILVLSFIFALIELTPLRDLLRSLFRASNNALHYARISSFYLYPGDLGAASSIIGSCFLRNWLIRNESFEFTKRIKSTIIIAITILVLLSQSRLGIFQWTLTVGLALYFLRGARKFIFVPLALGSILTILILFKSQLNYLFKIDPFVLIRSFTSYSEASGNKRALELFGVFGFGNTNTGFIEGSFPSLIYNTNLLIGIFIFLFLIIYLIRGTRKIKENLIITIPLILTSVISAPFERPKLIIVSVLAISLCLKQK